MGRFMLAMLADSRDGVLSPASRAKFLRPQFRDHPQPAGRDVRISTNGGRTGERCCYHDGTLDDQVGVLLLDPTQVSGCSPPRTAIRASATTCSHPCSITSMGAETPPPPGTPLRGTGHATDVAGVCTSTPIARATICSSVRALMPMLQAHVVADGDAIVFRRPSMG
jgi:hypothetical protein